MAKKKLNFREALHEVEATIQKIEANELELDALFDEVKRSSQLLRECSDTLYRTQDELNKFFDSLDQQPSA